MAGTNGKDKFLTCTRNNEIVNPKFRGSLFTYAPDQVITAGTTQITADQWVEHNIILPAGTVDPILGPSTTTLVQQLSQEGLFVQGESVHLLISNADPVNSQVITLGANWNPTSITLPPNSLYQIVYKINTNPVGFEVDQIYAVGAANPAGNAAPAPATFGNDFQLTPSVARDVIVRDATNTFWVPSGTTNGGKMPFLILRGNVLSPTNDMLRIDDVGGLNTYTNFADIRQTQDAAAATTNFHLINAVSQAPNFGNRGVGLTDTIYRSQITTAGTPNGFHARFGTAGVDVFHVRSNGVTKVTLAAGPPVTNIAVDATGQICAAASSQAVKENIINATNSSFVNDFQVREFNFIGDNVKQVGAVVEELEPLIPEALRPAIINYKINWAYTDAEGVFHPMTRDFTKPESINLQGVVFALLREHQALRARVAALEAA